MNEIFSEYQIPPTLHEDIRTKVIDILRVYTHVVTTPIDPYYPEVLRRVAACLNGAPVPDQEKLTAIGEEFDHLGRSAGFQSLIGAVTIAALSCISPTKGFAVVATARNEGPFLVEWIAHQYAVGFEEIYIYTNNNNDGSDALLRELAAHGYIKLFNNETSNVVNPQVKAYEHLIAFGLPLRAFEWVMFLDCDEFPILEAEFDFTIPGFIGGMGEMSGGGEQPDCVCFNWLWYGSNGRVRSGVEPVKDRFTYAAPASGFVKSIFRTAKALSMQDVHKPRLFAGSRAVNSAMQPATLEGRGLTYEYTNGWVNHYWNKSFEEFLVKRARGDERPEFGREMALFFQWDIPCDPVNQRILDQTINARSSAKHAEIMSHESIRLSHQAVMASYKVLASRLQRESSLEDIYAREKTYAEILEYFDTSNVVCVETSAAREKVHAEILGYLEAHASVN